MIALLTGKAEVEQRREQKPDPKQRDSIQRVYSRNQDRPPHRYHEVYNLLATVSPDKCLES
jgi:hypothetical protein